MPEQRAKVSRTVHDHDDLQRPGLRTIHDDVGRHAPETVAFVRKIFAVCPSPGMSAKRPNASYNSSRTLSAASKFRSAM
jgi:hypothetical protein